MRNRFVTKFVCSLLLAVFAWPAIGRAFLRCDDGSTCSSMHVVKKETKHDCCGTESKKDAADKRCVGNGSMASAPAASVPVLNPLDILIFAPIVLDLTPAVAITTITVVNDRPPARIVPKQGCAPRGPPTAIS